MTLLLQNTCDELACSLTAPCPTVIWLVLDPKKNVLRLYYVGSFGVGKVELFPVSQVFSYPHLCLIWHRWKETQVTALSLHR